jgi:hypothetical protein
MANINTKQHLFVLVQGKNGPEKREVKFNQSNYKLKEKMMKKYSEGSDYNKNKAGGSYHGHDHA